MAHAAPIDLSQVNRSAGGLADAIVRGGYIIGALFLLLAVITTAFGMQSFEVFLRAWLVNFCFYTSLMLGGLFFVIIQHLTRSGWSVVVRRLGEHVAATAPITALFALPLVIFASGLYPWTNDPSQAQNPILAEHKSPWLNQPLFAIRMAIYFVGWILIARYFRSQSIAQDASGDIKITERLQTYSAPATLFYALSVTLFAFDAIMSLKPDWYSTIFGVLYFAGAVIAFFALLILLSVGLQSSGRLTNVITHEHYHDMGKLMFAFIVFWAYIAFSQYMLIWYGNLAEETLWYYYRFKGGWLGISLMLLFMHFFAPFILLMSRVPKRMPSIIAIGAAYMLLMHWFDVIYLVGPPPSDMYASPVPLIDGLLLIGMGGIWVGYLGMQLREGSLLCEKDPRLPESLRFQNF